MDSLPTYNSPRWFNVREAAIDQGLLDGQARGAVAPDALLAKLGLTGSDVVAESFGIVGSGSSSFDELVELGEERREHGATRPTLLTGVNKSCNCCALLRSLA